MKTCTYFILAFVLHQNLLFNDDNLLILKKKKNRPKKTIFNYTVPAQLVKTVTELMNHLDLDYV